MNNKTKYIIAFLVFGVVGFSVYFLYKKYKKSGGFNISDAEKPPISADGTTELYAPESGFALDAIERRISELAKAGFYDKEALSLEDADNLVFGELKNPNYWRGNVGGIANIPFPLNPGQKAALKVASKEIFSSGMDFGDIRQVIQKYSQAMEQNGLPNPLPMEARASDGKNFLKKFLWDCYPGESHKVSIITSNTYEKNLNAIVLASKDLSEYSSGVLSLSELLESAAREKAIQDLRNQGWKFLGYDMP